MALFVFDNDFDASKIDVSDSFEPIPAGAYKVLFTNAEKLQNKNGSGYHMKAEFTVCDGPCKGRKVFARFNLWHPNPDAVRFARRDLAKISLAVGVPRPRCPEDLFGKPFAIKVTVETLSNGKQSNNVENYGPVSALGGAPAAPVAAPPPVQAPVQQAPAAVQAPPPAAVVPPVAQPPADPAAAYAAAPWSM